MKTTNKESEDVLCNYFGEMGMKDRQKMVGNDEV